MNFKVVSHQLILVRRIVGVALLFAGLVFALGPAVPAQAANLIVSDCGDTGGANQLRQKIAAAASNDTVTITCTGTINVSANGTLVIGKNLTINGPGAGNLAISGGDAVRVFDIGAFTANISGVSITHGKIIGFDGAGVNTLGTSLTVTSVVFDNNNTSGGRGAAINMPSGALTVINSSFTNNTADGDGGAIENNGAILVVVNSTFFNNLANGDGGAIDNNGGTLTISGCTFNTNSGGLFGGAIWTTIPTTISNSTFFNNKALGAGGGIEVNGSVTNLINVTFSGNGALIGGVHPIRIVPPKGGRTLPQSPPFFGGAINNAAGTVNLKNTILANSTAGGNCNGIMVDFGNNLQFNPNAGCGVMPAGDPKLSALANNGGPTQTMALNVSSAALDKGNNSICSASPVNNLDQRGVSRPQPPGGICDVGAYELLQAPAEVPEADTLLLMGGGLGGLATWLGWQRRKLRARMK